MASDNLKRAAAERALEFIEPGMRLGLGTGSTAAAFVSALAEKGGAGMKLTCVATSEATQAQAEKLGLAMSTLDDTPKLDLTVDGADEIGPGLALIKGGGGALLREKIVAAASERMVVIADESKLVARLGAFPLPVEVVPFGATATVASIKEKCGALGVGGDITRRMKGDKPFVTDNGNFIYDCHFSAIPMPGPVANTLATIPGVVEHGLFLELASHAIVAGEEGGVQVLTR